MVECMPGAFTPAADDVVIDDYFTEPPITCPPSGFPIIASILSRACIFFGEGYAYQVGCSATNVTLSVWLTSDCSGPPLEPPSPIFPIGCDPGNITVPNYQLPSNTTCPVVPSDAAIATVSPLSPTNAGLIAAARAALIAELNAARARAVAR
jgi:hypothetical protein